MNKQNYNSPASGGSGSYFPRATNRKNSGGLVTQESASTTPMPGPNIGLRGTLKK